jgi:arabinofuranosyltransferase
MMRARARDQLIIIAAAVALLVLCYLIEARVNNGYIGAPVDDTYIHMQFADNILAGNGFSYNPGEAVPGSTSPLWVMLITLGGLFTDDLLKVSLFLSSLFYILTGIGAYRVARKLLVSPGWSLPAALLVLFTGRLLWAGVSGMETALFAALCLFGSDFHAGRRNSAGRPSLLAAVLLSLASQARPEGYLLFGAFVVDNFIKINLKDGKRRVFIQGFPWASMLIFILIVLPYMVFAFMHTGHPLPTSFYAKHEVFNWPKTWRYVRLVVEFFYHDNLVIYMFLPIGIGAWFLRLFRQGTEGERPGWNLVLYWALGQFIVSSILFPSIFHFQRYMIPVLPFYIILCILGLERIVEFWKRSRGRDRVPRIVSAAVLVAALLWGVFMSSIMWPGMTARCVKNIRQMQVRIGEWVKRGTFEDDLIASNDIGAIFYISKRRVLDLIGLVTPEIIPHVSRIDDKRERDKAVLRFLSEKRPDYLVIFPNWYPTLARDSNLFVPVFSVELKDNLICGGDRMVVYKCMWNRYRPASGK